MTFMKELIDNSKGAFVKLQINEKLTDDEKKNIIDFYDEATTQIALRRTLGDKYHNRETEDFMVKMINLVKNSKSPYEKLQNDKELTDNEKEKIVSLYHEFRK